MRLRKIYVKPSHSKKGSLELRRVDPHTIKPNNSVNIVETQHHPMYSSRKSNRVFIVGGGSSLANFDFSLLKTEDVICVNKAIEYIDNPTYFITMDYTFFEKTSLSIDDIIRKTYSSYFIVNNTSNKIKLIDGTYVNTVINHSYTGIEKFTSVIVSTSTIDDKTGFGLSYDTFANGNNSGFCAVQLAILEGYTEIYLLGFDLIDDNGLTHFHNSYNVNVEDFKRNAESYKENFIGALNKYHKNIFYTTSKDSVLPHPKYVSFKDLEGMISSNKNSLNDLIVVGYYTKNTPYEEEAKKLINSLDKLTLSYDIQCVDNLGSWQANTRFKANFMLEMLNKHEKKRLLYVDCDAVIHKLPILFENYHCDIAVRWEDFAWRKNECLSGTIYMENNERTRELCNRWANLNENESPTTQNLEQWNLGRIIKDMELNDGLSTLNLPPEYTFIFDYMKALYPRAIPIIEHFQASRKFKNII